MKNLRAYIDLKPWVRNAIWSVLMIGIGGLWFMAVQKKAEAPITKVRIGIKGLKGGRNLITRKEVKKLFFQYLGYDLENSLVGDLELRGLENFLEQDERIKRAEIYVDKHDVVTVLILQRSPIVRVFSQEGESFYLDSDGAVIDALAGGTIRVPVATGQIESYNPKLIWSKKSSHLKDVFEVAKYIHNDEFLEALVEQVDIDENGDITLIPKVGRQKLVLGKAEDLDDRFEKLKLMYREGLPKLGWRKYDVLTLKYDGQIVGKKSMKKNRINQ